MNDQQETVAALIVLDEAQKDPSASAEDLYARCLARGVDLRHQERPLGAPLTTCTPTAICGSCWKCNDNYDPPPGRSLGDGLDCPPEQRRTATAYLCMVHRMGADGVPQFRGFSIYSEVPWGLSASRERFCTIYYQLEADSYDAAQRRLLETCRDFTPFRWIWPWVDPSHEAHLKRFDMIRALEADGG